MLSPGEAAIAYARRGWHVLPLAIASKAPSSRLVPRGKNDASADVETVRHWWSRAPFAGVGISCRASGLVAIDIDPRHGGDDRFHDLERELGPLPVTPEALTGGGGRHVLLTDPGGQLLGQLAEGVEIKSSGYVVAAPSLHTSGARYAWDVDRHPDDTPLATVPPAWLERMVQRLPAVAVQRDLRPSAGGGGQALDDPLLTIDARTYFPILTGREPNRQGYVRCPFHKGGQEERPDLKLYGTRWACFACPPVRPGARCAGGSIYTLAALVWGYPLPLRGPAFLQVSDRLIDVLQEHYERRMAAA